MIVALPVRIEPLREVRTTLISASLVAIRDRGHNDAYFAALDPDYREVVRSIVPGEWAPAALAMAHYAACEKLGLSGDDQFAIGRDVGLKVQQSLVGTLVRLAKDAGATPWTIFGHIERLWTRMMRGSAIGVWETGPKDARVEIRACALARFDYCRNGWRGIMAGLAEQVSRRVYVNDLKHLGSDERFVAQVSWA